MNINSNKSADTAVGRQLVEFLDSQSILHHEQAICATCGSKMQYREFHFWLAGTGMTWDVTVPVCPGCAQPKNHKVLEHQHAA